MYSSGGVQETFNTKKYAEQSHDITLFFNVLKSMGYFCNFRLASASYA